MWTPAGEVRPYCPRSTSEFLFEFTFTKWQCYEKAVSKPSKTVYISISVSGCVQFRFRILSSMNFRSGKQESKTQNKNIQFKGKFIFNFLCNFLTWLTLTSASNVLIAILVGRRLLRRRLPTG